MANVTKKRGGGGAKNPNSLANLRPPWTSEDAKALQPKRDAARAMRKYTRKKFKEELTKALALKIKPSKKMRDFFASVGLEIEEYEDITPTVFKRALFEALKTGDIRQVMMMAEFAGFRNDQEEDELPNGGKITFEVIVPAPIPKEVEEALAK